MFANLILLAQDGNLLHDAEVMWPMVSALFIDLSNFELHYIPRAICHVISDLTHQGEKVMILVESRKAAQKIDSMLWEFDEEAFVPHCVIEEATGFDSVVITPYLGPEFSARYLINLTSDVPAHTNNFENIVEFVYRKDKSRLERSRRKWKKYEELGITREYKKHWGDRK